MLPRHAGADLGLEETQIERFAHHDVVREGVDAGEGDVQVGEDLGLAALDDVLAEALEVAGPGRADVEPGRRPGAARQLVGVDAQRGAAPIDVGMEVDHARHDDSATDLALDLGRARLRVGAQGRDLAVLEGDVQHLVGARARIDDPPATQNNIEHRHHASPRNRRPER